MSDNRFDDGQCDPIDDLTLARDLIKQNHDLLIKYPSLEDSLKLLERVIKLEQSP